MSLDSLTRERVVDALVSSGVNRADRSKVMEAMLQRSDGGRGKGDRRTVYGHAAVFNSMSEDLGGFREIIKPGCFARAIREKQDVRALIDHDSSLVLGRTGAGTLRISEDDQGLAVEIDLPATSFATDLAESMDRGDMTQMSFGFRTVSDSWRKENGLIIRDLLDVDCFDVSVVTYPAYTAASCTVRLLQGRLRENAGALTHPLQDPEVARMMAEMRR